MKAGDREAPTMPDQAHSLPALTWIPLKATVEKLGRTRNATRLEYGHKCR